MLPQVPQLVGSLAALTQTLPGQIIPGHIAWQPKLAAQNGAVAGQAMPQPPQLYGSEAGFVQTVPHSNKPFVHTHSPPTHCRPGAHPPLQVSLSSSSLSVAAGVQPTNKVPTIPSDASSASSRFMVRQSVIGAPNAQGDLAAFFGRAPTVNHGGSAQQMRFFRVCSGPQSHPRVGPRPPETRLTGFSAR
jgi:hypothetical protein